MSQGQKRNKRQRWGACGLVLAAALALGAAAPGSGDAPPPPPRPAAPAPPAPPAPDGGSAAETLVPGVASAAPETPLDTPDQVLPPLVYEPGATEDRAEPAAAPEDAYRLIEYVPQSEVTAKPGSCTTKTGPYQRQVERWLRLKVDGRQSAADCAAIRKFQQQQGISPTIGFAGPVTWSRMQFLSARKNPNAAHKCPVRKQRVACVDLTRQLMWVQTGSKVTFGPVPIRSGRASLPTRGGWHKIYWRHKNHVSSIYHQAMPYAQFFDGGQAFHAIYHSVYTSVGSQGCVNLSLTDARRLWDVLRNKDLVYVWGHRDGT
ncbi:MULTISPECIES: L,D-transpeptidase family protein [unclassified Streptomyces]|uniref:L,D-transpeptidase family protein n=1 Tax=unclassified Streptomyces TaxID=2593676 RepID=UPI000C272ED7|nr:L,D-transpeptidase family protein [Streptomyces sp. CB01201]MBX7465847.1 L,D-transpeptidase family protein [Streptomyces sp. MAG02]PJM99815.1 L,D-transpeptidase [Streptomyces sp. CB01201]